MSGESKAVSRPQASKQLEILVTEDGLLLSGDQPSIDNWLRDHDIEPERGMNVGRILGNTLSLAIGVYEHFSGATYVKVLTKKTAAIANAFGGAEALQTGVIRNDLGQIIKHAEFSNLQKIGGMAISMNPYGAVAIGMLAAIEVQNRRLRQSIEAVDEKVSYLIQDQKDEKVAELIGLANSVEEATAIASKVGDMSEVTWSKIASDSAEVEKLRAYAIMKVKASLKKLTQAQDAGSVAEGAKSADKDLPNWLAVLTQATILSNQLISLEAQRVLAIDPEKMPKHLEALRSVREKRAAMVAEVLRATSRLISEKSQVAKEGKLLRPWSSSEAIAHLNSLGEQISMFASDIDVDLIAETFEDESWFGVAGEAVASTAGAVAGFGSWAFNSALQAGASALHSAGDALESVSGGNKVPALKAGPAEGEGDAKLAEGDGEAEAGSDGAAEGVDGSESEATALGKSEGECADGVADGKPRE